MLDNLHSWGYSKFDKIPKEINNLHEILNKYESGIPNHNTIMNIRLKRRSIILSYVKEGDLVVPKS